jgi:hypothetical protein
LELGGGQGPLGGILLGIREDTLQVEDWEVGEHFVATIIRNMCDNWRWRMVTVYGPADHAGSVLSWKNWGVISELLFYQL